MSYNSLSQLAVTASADTTGLNPGNLTCAFDTTDLPNINTCEIYHMTITGAPVFAAAQIVLRNKIFSTVTADINGNNEWDPNQAAIVNAGDQVYFLWNINAASATKPMATIWLRYDPNLPQNVYR